jgi:hypothetical protein
MPEKLYHCASRDCYLTLKQFRKCPSSVWMDECKLSGLSCSVLREYEEEQAQSRPSCTERRTNPSS